jgi:hypothetical protein
MADTPRPGLALTALRYAAGELPATEAAVFDAQLAVDQDARDALGEAIRPGVAWGGWLPSTGLRPGGECLGPNGLLSSSVPTGWARLAATVSPRGE